MQQKMVYRGFEIKIWDGKRGLGLRHNSYVAQTTKPPIITVRRNSISHLKNDMRSEIDKIK